MNKFNFLGFVLFLESCMYLGTYYGLNKYNNKFKLLNFDRKLYVVKNLVKSRLLAIISLVVTPYFFTSLL